MSEETVKQVVFRVQRFDPEKDSAPHFQEYAVPASKGTTVLDGLIYIKENVDSTIAFRSSCRMSICGSCAVIVNDYPHLACHTQIDEFHSNTLTLKPLNNMPIIKDLVCSLDAMFEHHRAVKPWLVRDDKDEVQNPKDEYSQSPDELLVFSEFTNCVKCGACVAACPTSASDKLFLGPQALTQCYRYCADNRDSGEQERLRAVDPDHGVFHCHLAGACSEACPKGVDPALAIQLLKRRMSAKALGFGKKQKPAAVVPPPAQTKEKIPFPKFNVNR